MRKTKKQEEILKESEKRKRNQDLPTWLHMGCERKYSCKFWKEKLFVLGLANFLGFSEAVDSVPEIVVVGDDAAEADIKEAQVRGISIVTPDFVLQALKTKVIPDATNISFSHRDVAICCLSNDATSSPIAATSSSSSVISGKSSSSTNVASISSVNSFSSVSTDVTYSSSTDAVSSSSTPPSSTDVIYPHKMPGFLFRGDGSLAAFQGIQVNRKIARYYAREFKLRWHDNSASALRLLSQLKMILIMDRAVKSGLDAQASHSKGSIGPSGITIIDKALSDFCAPPHNNDASDEAVENDRGLLLWAVYWIDMGCVPY
jgi:hypothetical protein